MASVPPSAPPRGFYRHNAGWLATGFALSFLSSFGQTFFIALFAGEIRAAHGLSDGDWGALYTAATLLSALALLRLGGLADTLRLDRLAPAVLVAYALAALAMAASAGLGPAGIWLLFASVVGLRLCGQGMMSHLSVTAMGKWFRARRGQAVAVAGFGFSTGEALLPTLAVALALAVGWRETWVAVALFLLLAAALLPRALARARTPEGSAAANAHPGRDGTHWTRPRVLRHWLFWALLPAVLTPPFIGTVLFFHQVHIAEVKGWSLAAMAAGYPVYAGLTVVSAFLGGWAVDRLGPAQLLPLYLVPIAAASALLAPAETVSGWLAILALTGVTQGLAQALWGALWPELYGTAHLGAVRATAVTAMVVATAAGPGITGVLIDRGVPFPDQGLALAAASLAVSALALLARRGIRRLGAPA